ncbi:hypothetical protein [Paraburkholderia tropica]|uniref:hypothetical protein n=1 Tax=Paraburkholderia tropica TaxID=92647 RepID=UPI002AB085CB|nr:hypothetical protein [Paraburkholderia tropica]
MFSDSLLARYASDAEKEIRIVTGKQYDVKYVAGLEPSYARRRVVPIEVNMPMLRVDQAAIVADPAQFKVVRCGRRYGKTVILEVVATDALVRGERVALFVPQLLTSSTTYKNILSNVGELATNRHFNKRIETSTGGILEIFPLNTGGIFARGREYDVYLFDEAAFIKADSIDYWENGIEPMLAAVENPRVYVFSTTQEDDVSNWFFALHHAKRYQYKSDSEGFKQFHRPTHMNPQVKLSYLKMQQRVKHPLSFRQEYLAEFVDWSGTSLFSFTGPCDEPMRLTHVFAVLDSAVKGGFQHDGTAVMYFGYREFVLPGQPQLVILDWSVWQLDAVVIKSLFPSILNRAVELARQHNAVLGFIGLFVEDKASGPVLIQEAQLAGMPVDAINSKYTAVGKDARAMAIVDVVASGNVGWSPHAFNKTQFFKGEEVNHALRQVVKYRIGDPDAHKRADDAFDAWAYGVIIGLKPDSFGA